MIYVTLLGNFKETRQVKNLTEKNYNVVILSEYIIVIVSEYIVVIESEYIVVIVSEYIFVIVSVYRCHN